ncbi:hypothetical protein ABMA28_009340 [Loxostege sticticalis]|uniref:Gustatory receptor n=1 Tax=Loxostege sticticalis TaxID=481309 RepID=A0ABD0SF47_LOXSC
MQGLNIYKTIYDGLDRVKISFDYLIYNFPSFQEIDDLNRIIFLLQIVILLFAPAISAGLITSKFEELQVILQDRLLTERNEPYSDEIELFMDYIHTRPMNFTVFNIFPLDWTLPVNIVNLCITYQIAIVQLTDFAANSEKWQEDSPWTRLLLHTRLSSHIISRASHHKRTKPQKSIIA